MGLKKLILSIVCLTLFACQAAVLAQTIVPTPGLIYKPALNGGSTVLDPNGDGYVSKTKSGFTGTSDGETFSEIPYKPFPVIPGEPVGDLATGPKFGHTDYADPNPLAYYFDGTNFLFRVRLAGQSTASKGYSILIDTNNSVTGNGKNPGFEYEVVLASNFDVRVYNHTGSFTSPGPQIFSGSVDQYSQKAVAATTEGGSPDYFYDYYVPISAFGGAITGTTPIRMAGVTVTSGGKGLFGTLSDKGAVDDRNYKGKDLDAFKDIISTYPPTTPSGTPSGTYTPPISAAPQVFAPIYNNSTTIQGSSSEVPGSVITVYRNGVLLGTTTVNLSGLWSIAAGTLAIGDVITATAKAPTKNTSALSQGVSVEGTYNSCQFDAITPEIMSPLDNGKGFRIWLPFLFQTGTLRLYKIQSVDGNTETGFPISLTGTFWNFGAGTQAEFYTATGSVLDGLYYVTFTPSSGGCESIRSNFICVKSYGTGNDRADGTPNPAPTITTSALNYSSATIEGTAEANQTVRIYKNNLQVGSVPSNASGVWTYNIPTNSLNDGDVFWARTLKTMPAPTAGCQQLSSRSNSVTASFPASTAPVITGTYCGTTTVITGTSTEASGTQIRILVGGTEITSPAGPHASVSQSGVWIAENLNIPAGSVVTATARALGESVSPASNSVTISSPYTVAQSALTINAPVTEGSTALSGTAPNNTIVTLYINGEEYLDDLGNPATVTANGSGIWSMSNISPFALYVGASLTISAKNGATCESTTRSNPVIVQCRPIADTNIPIRFTQPVTCPNTKPTVFMERSEPGIIYNLYVRTSSQTDDQASVFSTSVVGTGKGIYLTSTNPITFSDNSKIVFIKGIKIDAPSSCSRVIGNPQYLTLTVLNTAASKNYSLTVPASQQDLCPNNSSTITVVGAEAGLVYQLYIAPNVNNKVGPAIQRNTAGDFSFPPLPVASTTTYGLSVSTIDNGCSVSNNTSQNITIRRIAGPTVNQTVSPTSQTVCQNQATSPISFTTQSGYTYRVFDKGTGAQITSFAGNGAAMSFSPSTSTLGTKTYRIEVTGAGCTSNLITEPQVTVTNSSTAPVSAGNNQTLCGATSTTLTGSDPAPGTGLWTKLPSSPTGGVITTPTSSSTTVTGLVSGTYVFRWTVTTTCGTEFRDVTITVNCPPSLFIAQNKYVDQYTLNETVATLTDPDGGIPSTPTVSNGTLPPGMQLATSSNVGILRISNPSALVAGTYSFTVRSVDARGVASNTPMLIRMYSRTAPPPPLPVQLMAFTGRREYKHVALSWATASELDNDYFEVQRSSNSKDFETIGKVQGAGNSTQVLQYNFMDSNAGVGTVYYRLKQFDFSGTYTFSNVIVVSLGNEINAMQAQAYPNPFDNQLNLMVNSPTSSTIVWELVNINGQMLATDSMKVSGGLNNAQIPISGLPKGMYVLKLIGKDINKSIKVIKSK